MAKNRTLPFGYIMANGETVPQAAEVKEIRSIFQCYASGKSYKWIAGNIKLPFSEARPEWNKNKVARLLADERYIGKNGYPALIDVTLFNAVQSKITDKTPNYNHDKNSLTLAMRGVAFCECCGRQITRIFTDRRNEKFAFWKCENRECDNDYSVEDNELRSSICTILKAMNESDIAVELALCVSQNAETVKLENRIARSLESTDFDYFKVVADIMALASRQYEICEYSAEHKTERIIDTLHQWNGETLTADIFSSVVKNVIFTSDNIKIKLQNGRIVDYASS